MSHTPFILAAYSIAAVILLWTAVSPQLKRRALLRELKQRQSAMEKLT